MKPVTRIFMALLFLACFSAAHAETLSFGVVGAESQESLAAMWSPLLLALQQRTGIVLKPYFGKDYQSIVDGMNRGEIQVGSFGSRSAIEVVDQGEGEVFAQWIDEKGKRGYVSYVVARKIAPWKTFDAVLRDGKKLRFAFGDPKSTSGTLVPQYYLFAQRKIKAEGVFRRVVRGNHEQNVEDVLNGSLDVATTNSQILDKLAARESEKFARLKILWTSPLIPQDALMWRKDIPEETKKKLRTFFLSFGMRPEERRLMKERMGLSGFGASDDNQLLPVRQIELYRQRQSVELETELPVKEQFRRLMEIDAQLVALAAKVTQLRK